MILRICLFGALAALALPASLAGGPEKDYFPLRVGSEWHYHKKVTEDRKVLEMSTVVVRVARVEDRPLEEKGKKANVQVFTLEIAAGKKPLTEEVAVLADGVCRFSQTGKAITPPLLFLKLPVQKGLTWRCDSLSNDVLIKGTFKMDQEEITVAAIKKTPILAVTCTAEKFQIGDQTQSVKSWFADKFGLVKQEVRVGNYEITLELQQYRMAK